jgi:hypothetical protein
MAKYSDDAKYRSAFDASLKASNKAKLYLQELNKATPGTAKHTELQIKYDAAKALYNTEEAKRVARKTEIDRAETKEKTDKEAAKKKESLKTELPQLEYQLQVAKNKGDAAGIKTAQDAIKAAQDKAAGIKPKDPNEVVQGEDAGVKADVSLTDFLKSVIGNVEKIKKLQQALKDAKVYKGPVNGIFNADVLLSAAEKAEEKLDRYESLGITFADRFEGYTRLATSGGAGDGLGLTKKDLPSRQIYEYTQADRQKMIDDVSVTLRGQGITDADKSAKWYKDLKKSIDNMISTGTLSTTKDVFNPKTKKMESRTISTPGFSQEQVAATAEKAIRQATPEDVARKERVDFTSWMFGTLGGSNG